MGVCFDKDAVIQDDLSVTSIGMPTSSTAKLRAANKRVNIPGKSVKNAEKKTTSTRVVQEAKHIEDKVSLGESSTPTKDSCPDASAGGDNESPAPSFDPASANINGVDAVEKNIADAEPPLQMMGTLLPNNNAGDALANDDSKINHSGAILDSPSKKEQAMGNLASSKLKTGKNGSTEKEVKTDGDGSLNTELEPPSNMNADNAAVKCSAEESVVLTETVASFKMPNIPDLTKPAPDFCGQAVVDGQFKEIKLSDYKGKYLVLFFYPLDFTFVCPTEIISFSDRAEDFRKVNCELIACSTDSQYSHFAWVSTSRKQGGLGALNIPLLADKTGQIAKDYGCFKEDEGIAFRGLYIIDDKGRLRQITINDLPVGRSVDETLRLVQAFQFTDKYGEVCPAGWKPGDKSMKPDPAGSKEYFQDKH